MIAFVVVPVNAAAAPVPDGSGEDGYATVVKHTAVNDRMLDLTVHSPAMGRDIPVTVLLPADRSRPRGSLYLLDGNSGQTASNNWLAANKGNIVPFFADKNVNVVLPVGGTGTLYTDWEQEHPKFGAVKWETFLVHELPQALEPILGSNDDRAIGGISSGAQGALMLAQRNPGFYRAVAGYSGCYQTAGPAGETLMDLTVINGGATSELMWGPAGSPQWQSHDLFANAAALRGTSVYLSSGSGLPGPHEFEGGVSAQRVLVGGPLEFGSNLCTDQLTDSLRTHGVAVTRSRTPVGVHDWPYWRDELARSWPTLQGALGV